jgi:hypothetical protein
MMPWSQIFRSWRKSKSDAVNNSTSRLSRWLYPTIFSFILSLYTGLSLYQINLPGLHYDEAFEAVPALQILLGQPVAAFRGSALSLRGQNFPLMTQDYIGALNTYLVLPFIGMLGSTPLALRLMSISVGLISLILTYLLATRLTASPGIGLSAMLLLTVEPTFIFWNRQGIFVTALTATIGLAATYCWLRRFQGGAWGWSLGGAFLFGLGLYTKFLFLWLIFALVGAALLLNLPALFELLTSPTSAAQSPATVSPYRVRGDYSRKFQNYFIGIILRIPSNFSWKRVSNFREVKVSLLEAGGCLAAFALGCWPLILYNLQTGGTLLSISQNSSTSYYGVNNLAFGANLGERLGQFLTLLDGGHLWYLGAIIHNLAPVSGFFLVLVLITLFAMRIRLTFQTALTGTSSKIAFFPFLVIGLTIGASIGTVSALWITHFAILMPWPTLALALGGHFLYSHLHLLPGRRERLAQGGIWLALALITLSNLSSTIRYHQALAESGGLSSHSDAIYDLSEWLARRPGQPVVAMDWGLAASVTYLTGGQVTPIEVFGYGWQSDVQLSERLEQAMNQPTTLYLWRAPDEVIFDRSDQFKALYRPRNLEETIEEAFYERSGRPLLGVTRLVEKGTAGNPPK